MHRAIDAWLSCRDETAARALMDALYPQVIRIVRNHLPFRLDEEDLAQEVFTQFFKTLDRYNPARPLENWVSRLALNVCLKALRSRKRRPELRWADLSEEERAVAELLLQEAEGEAASGEETKALLQRMMEALGANDRMLLTLLHLEEKSLEEIEVLTGWSSVVIRMRAYRARRRLRKMFAGLR
ncbi:MAG: sigma-70 family RNA polymerase sigma factor [Verrucomicrobiota bacterium]|nr:sigma-70 family RNA polymerase sigma factor [Verrucomicrobiota bacterium]